MTQAEAIKALDGWLKALDGWLGDGWTHEFTCPSLEYLKLLSATVAALVGGIVARDDYYGYIKADEVREATELTHATIEHLTASAKGKE